MGSNRTRTLLALAGALLLAGGGPARGLEGLQDTRVSAEAVTAIFQDRSGFLWIGSRHGLSRYDGYASYVFEHDVADPASISDNSIRTVFEDRAGRLWIGTNTGGLNRLDPDTWTFRHWRHDSADPRSLPHDSVYSVVEDADGRLWIGTQGGLARFDPETERFERFPAGPEGPPNDYVAGLHLDGEGALFVATVGGGLARRDPKTGAYRVFRHDRRDPGSIPSDRVFDVEDGDGSLWIATESGVARLGPESHGFDRPAFDLPPETPAPLVTGIEIDPSGRVWAATFSSGLFVLEPGKDRFRRVSFRIGGAERESARIVVLLADRLGSIWVGTWGEGLGRVPPGAGLFEAIVPSSGRTVEVTSVARERAGGVWVGSDGGTISRVPRAPGDAPIVLGGSPLAIRESTGGELWVGTASGVARVDPRTGRAVRFVHDPADATSLGAGWVWTILEDTSGRIWVGTGEGGLDLLRADGTFERLVHDPADPGSLSDNYVTALLEDRDGRLWVGTRSGGLNSLDAGSRRFVRYPASPERPDGLSHHSVSYLLLDREESIWVGTSGGGLNRVRRDAADGAIRFERFTERDGLIDDNVVGLAEDDDGSLWIGTRRGLSRFDPRSRTFINYGTEDGLPGAEFGQGAAAVGRDGIYFGTPRGGLRVLRGTPFVPPPSSPTVVTAFRVPNGEGRRENPGSPPAEIQVPYGRILSFEFAVLDFGDRRRHRYGYRLEGTRGDWIDLGGRREITFTDLDPGRYRLRVRGRNANGVWSETAEPVAIRVVPPFWMTTWFRLVVALGIVGAAFAGHRVRTAALERRNRELVRLKDERERALEEARASQRTLHETYDRLRALTRRLEAAKEDERKRIARELHDEMGQALTTAKLNLELMTGTAAPEDRDRRIADTIGLLDRMIGHVRTLSLDLRPPLLDELGLSAALRGYLEAQARRTGIEFATEVGTLPSKIPTDVEIAAFRVVQESVTNVLRHAAAGKVEVEVGYDPGDLRLRIADDGRGFDVPAALERAAGGAHVGLLGMRERVESMGGEVTIDSAPGRGTCIEARLPLGD